MKMFNYSFGKKIPFYKNHQDNNKSVFATKVENMTSWDFKSVSESSKDKSAEAVNFNNNYMSSL